MDYIFHLATIIYGDDWEPFYIANVQGTENLLTACANVNPGLKKFIYVSSIAASGPSVKGRLKDEYDECRPTSLYGKSKLAAEKIVRAYGDRVPFVILRPPNVLGTRQRELKTLLLTLKKGISPRLGIGEKQTTICFVEDVVRSLILVAEEDAATGRTYFVTDNDTHSWREMIDTAARVMGKKFILKIPFPMVYTIALVSEGLSRVFGMKKLVNMIDIVDSRKRYWLFKSEKIRDELGFSPRITFEDGIKNIIDHYRQAGVL
jgi:nucleoside-diphosphate-sugar epimerase